MTEFFIRKACYQFFKDLISIVYEKSLNFPKIIYQVIKNNHYMFFYIICLYS